MDNRPIGIFDSGLGGLTVLKSLADMLPGEDIVYFGDTARVPYGGLSKDEIVRIARQDLNFLLDFGVKAVIAACGTVSTNALEEISEMSPVPVTGVVDSAVRVAVRSTSNGKIGIIGTEASIRSGVYSSRISLLCPDFSAAEVSCPSLVPFIESGRIGKNNQELRNLTENYLMPLKQAGIDTLILGCTHFPLISETISAIMGSSIRIIDIGSETASEFADGLRGKGLLSSKEHGTCRYFVSGDKSAFITSASAFLGSELKGTVERASAGE